MSMLIKEEIVLNGIILLYGGTNQSFTVSSYNKAVEQHEFSDNIVGFTDKETMMELENNGYIEKRNNDKYITTDKTDKISGKINIDPEYKRVIASTRIKEESFIFDEEISGSINLVENSEGTIGIEIKNKEKNIGTIWIDESEYEDIFKSIVD